eukprot:3432330-Rhodomonas_salina.3
MARAAVSAIQRVEYELLLVAARTSDHTLFSARFGASDGEMAAQGPATAGQVPRSERCCAAAAREQVG